MKASRAIHWLSVLVIMLLIAACGGDDTGSTPTEPDDGATDDGGDDGDDGDDGEDMGEANRSLRIGHPDAFSIYDVVSVVTSERLNAEGWDIEHVHFARSELNAQALSQNRIQVIVHQYIDPLRLIQAGGEFSNVRYVMENNGGEFLNIARDGIETCEDIDGQRYGVHGETATVAIASVNWLREDCGIEPNVLVIPGGNNRIIALENGELDATNVQLGDWLELQEIAGPDKYNVIDSGNLFDISGAALWVNTDWVDENHDVAVEFMAEMLRTYRMIHEDPSILVEAAGRHVDMSEEAIEPAVELYLDENVVGLAPVDGGSTEALQLAIDFFTETMDELDPGLTVDQIVHPTLLDEALQKLESEG